MALVLPAGAQCVRSVPLLSVTGATSSSTNASLIAVEGYGSAELTLVTANAAGTSPTLNVYIQKLLADGTTWDDIVAFTQVTGNIKKTLTFYGQVPSGDHTPNDAALAAGTIQTTSMGHTWRIKYVIAGTSPSFDITLSGDFLK